MDPSGDREFHSRSGLVQIRRIACLGARQTGRNIREQKDWSCPRVGGVCGDRRRNRAGLPGPTGEDRGAVRGGGSHRCHRPRRRRQAVPEPRQAVLCREPPRRRRQHGHGGRRAVGPPTATR